MTGSSPALLQTACQRSGAAAVAGMLSGYLASAGQAEAVAGAVRTVKAARPDAIYLCDPVIGDEDRLYVGEALAAAIRDKLLPLADIATPNAFECAWLAGDQRGRSARPGSARPPPPAASHPRHFRRRADARRLSATCSSTPSEHDTLRAPGAHDASERAQATFSPPFSLPGGCRDTTGGRQRRWRLSSVFEVVAGTAKAGGDELHARRAAARHRSPACADQSAEPAAMTGAQPTYWATMIPADDQRDDHRRRFI